jgi:mannose-6-phosphate isomerase-like protein (cupin superfamily)
MIISKETAEHYTWGQNCDGWHLLKSDSLSIIQEKMPGGTEEALHFHAKAQQFFYILSGQATFEIGNDLIEVTANEGLHIAPNQKHKIKNTSISDLHFLVISEPKAHGDRTNI